MISRSAWRLESAQLRDWLGALPAGGRVVVAPVEEGDLRVFRKIGAADEACLAPGKTRWSPKEFLFPRSENLYTYRFATPLIELRDPPTETSEQVLLGVRPCDAAGLARLDDVFLGGEVDPMYADRRRRTTVVSLACSEAQPECFCTAVGGWPAGTDGSDLQLAELDDGWLLRPLTDKGIELVADHSRPWSAANAEDLELVEAAAQGAADQIERLPVRAEWGELVEDRFDHPLWERLAESCLGCSICASVCPSCTCFDMHHVGSAYGGAQLRSWDSCTFSLFTRHATGHNPRSSKGERYRQRVLHKFAFGKGESPASFRCVGCGRCIELCPGGVDIVEVLREVAEATPEEAEHGRD